MKLSIAIVGRPSLNTARPDSNTSWRKRSTIGPSNRGSDSNKSSAARSRGNSLTSTGNASSHKHSTCPADNVNIPTPFDQKPAHLQDILAIRPDRTSPPTPYFFRRKQLSSPRSETKGFSQTRSLRGRSHDSWICTDLERCAVADEAVRDRNGRT